jgi:hypothetical protein
MIAAKNNAKVSVVYTRVSTSMAWASRPRRREPVRRQKN